MIREALQYLCDETRNARTPRHFKIDDEPPGVYHLLRPDGTYERCEALEAARVYSAADVESLVSLGLELAARTDARILGFVAADGVTLIADDAENRAPRAKWSLTRTSAYAWLAANRTGWAGYDHEGLMELLRGDLNEAANPATVKQFEQVAWGVGKEGENTLQIGNESLKSATRATMTASGSAVPGSFALTCRAYVELRSEDWDVTVRVLPRPRTGKILLRPDASELDAFEAATRSVLLRTLRTALPDATIVAGEPAN